MGTSDDDEIGASPSPQVVSHGLITDEDEIVSSPTSHVKLTIKLPGDDHDYESVRSSNHPSPKTSSFTPTDVKVVLKVRHLDHADENDNEHDPHTKTQDPRENPAPEEDRLSPDFEGIADAALNGPRTPQARDSTFSQATSGDGIVYCFFFIL